MTRSRLHLGRAPQAKTETTVTTKEGNRRHRCVEKSAFFSNPSWSDRVESHGEDPEGLNLGRRPQIVGKYFPASYPLICRSRPLPKKERLNLSDVRFRWENNLRPNRRRTRRYRMGTSRRKANCFASNELWIVIYN